MPTQEGELRPLTADDHALIGMLIESLGKQQTTQRGLRIAFLLLGLGSAMFAIRARNWLVLAVSAIATGVVIWLTRSGRGVAAVQADAAAGQKSVRQATIDDKYADDELYVLVIDGIPTAVAARWYAACARGDRVELDTLPRSQTLLAIRSVGEVE
jgi:hypothetical protein